MSLSILRSACAGALLFATAGCATLSDSTQQQLEVHTILDNREVAGVGCVLTNDVGRWFVMAPGRVTVERSTRPLQIECARAGTGSAHEEVASRFATDKLMGNVAISAGLGYLVDRHSGAGFAYPGTLTVLMHGVEEGANGTAATARSEGNVVF
jgi:hypothetical protein